MNLLPCQLCARKGKTFGSTTACNRARHGGGRRAVNPVSSRRRERSCINSEATQEEISCAVSPLEQQVGTNCSLAQATWSAKKQSIFHPSPAPNGRGWSLAWSNQQAYRSSVPSAFRPYRLPTRSDLASHESRTIV